MTEAYDKLRTQFKELPLTDRIAFIAEATVMTGQSALSDSMGLFGGVFENIGSSVDSIIKATGLSNSSNNVVSQTVERVAITVKDAGKAAGTIYKDVAKGVDDATGGIAKGLGDVTSQASEVVKNVTGTIQKTAAEVTSPKK
ncbi:chlorosome envelope protein C [Chloroherpeton thalassium ATCC 35110]|uniref:Chlorosome envelope protein C n=1 Tax=Chloroherpeton thalassium (strain ATCC 35110 / GB-78) TaxID=517418 RepID=B3QTL6_CHLT3|nr:chlorosome protein C [Chloroherpeton thalassium]ACF12762.1 chlorosome envelope protein C [Chloroherpeton thalassium ATCC 35110]